MNRSFRILTLLIIVSFLAACTNLGAGGKQVTIGGKNFTEQYLLSQMTVFMLRERGFDVDEMNNLGSTVVRKALVNKQIDLMWEYTGTALVTYMGKEPIADPGKAFEKVKELDEKRGIKWMNMSEVNNTYCFVMDKKEAKKYGIRSISDLAAYVRKHPGELKMATDAEFANRPDGLKGVEKRYDFNFGAEQVKQLETGLTYTALASGEVDVAMGFSTDAAIEKYDLLILKDDKHFFPPYYAAVSIHEDVYQKYPEVEEVTQKLADRLDSATMRKLNYRVDVEGKSVSVVAHDWLVKNGLIEK
ncbi:osmoprotectant transport system substrate-binding protein [Melghirimyces profundicolus]|uniref:Osmoprotectant transport system substrate-binding protein n=1 Tax=Melghirimyces profundicolus TaxID=1242148 RepID=A0A2T6AZT0_9BACL|nr:glycine betaine ABC transporter substrate-binding protein [Melghirimyces profundicolus]PTX49349.1 osmoprotectant transport system substrate-binding protein [Melghirimyces profundicolus]